MADRVECCRCGAAIADPDWWCWWCGAALCPGCGNGPGHCGHSGADEANRESARLKGYEDDREIWARIDRAQANVERVRIIFGLPERGRPKPN